LEVERRQPLREAAKLSCPIRWGLGPSKEIYIGHCSVPPMLCPFRKKYGPGLLFQFNKQAMIEIENYELLNNQLPSIDYFIDSSSIYCVTMSDSPWKLRNLFALSLVSSLLGCWQLGEFTNWSIMVNLTHVQTPPKPHHTCSKRQDSRHDLAIPLVTNLQFCSSSSSRCILHNFMDFPIISWISPQ
jgi:hypothetical protein